MIRRFNYTGRVKIPQSKITISLIKEIGGTSFSAKFNFAGMGIPDSAKVYIEANYKGVYQRFSFGSVGCIKAPESTLLSELPDTELVFFDVSVVDESGDIGLLLGKIRGISVSSNELPGNRISLLPVNNVDLKNEIWRMDFSSDDGRPVLELNNRIPGIQDKARTDPSFTALVFPAALRQILERLIFEFDEGVEEDSWTIQWKKFTTDFLGINYFPESGTENGILSQDQNEWITECVNAFSGKLQLFEKYISL